MSAMAAETFPFEGTVEHVGRRRGGEGPAHAEHERSGAELITNSKHSVLPA